MRCRRSGQSGLHHHHRHRHCCHRHRCHRHRCHRHRCHRHRCRWLPTSRHHAPPASEPSLPTQLKAFPRAWAVGGDAAREWPRTRRRTLHSEGVGAGTVGEQEPSGAAPRRRQGLLRPLPMRATETTPSHPRRVRGGCAAVVCVAAGCEAGCVWERRCRRRRRGLRDGPRRRTGLACHVPSWYPAAAEGPIRPAPPAKG
jgi:hypothetical protein